MHLDYKDQINLKIKEVEKYFEKEVDEFYKSPKIFRYKNKAEFSIAFNKNISIGFLDKNRNVIDIDDCLLYSERVNKIKNEFREFLRENLNKDLVRYFGILGVRESSYLKELMVIIISKKYSEEIRNLTVEFYKENEDYIDSMYLGVCKNFLSFYADEYYFIGGKKYIEEKVLDYKLKICPNCFFQTNSYTANILAKVVLENLDLRNNDIVYDLYSGIGTFSIPIANKSKKYIL